VSFALIIVLAACSEDLQAPAWVALLRLPWLRCVGKYSYAIYLLLGTGASCLAAAVTYRALEVHFLKLKNRFAP